MALHRPSFASALCIGLAALPRADAVVSAAAAAGGQSFFLFRPPSTKPGVSANLLDFNLADSLAGVEPEGTCVRRTGRVCQAYVEGTVIDQTKQCVQPMEDVYSKSAVSGVEAQKIAETAADCSQDGFCTCTPGFCAGPDMWCHQGSYKLLDEVFTISTSHGDKKVEKTKFDEGNQVPIFMAADGKLQVGQPPEPEMGRWRVAVMEDGQKIMSTEAYSTMVLQEHAKCTTAMNKVINKETTTCSLEIGGVENPVIRDSFWKFVPVSNRHGSDRGAYLLYEKTKAIVAVGKDNSISVCEYGAEDCPGEGAFYFDPPLPKDLLSSPPRKMAATMIFHAITLGVVVALTGAVCCAYSQLESKKTVHGFAS